MTEPFVAGPFSPRRRGRTGRPPDALLAALHEALDRNDEALVLIADGWVGAGVGADAGLALIER